MKLLAIESSTSLCSVALTDNAVLRERSVNAVGLHSSVLFAQIQELLAESELSLSALDAVLISAGPGSYTGLRIAASAVKGLLFQRDIPLFAVNTLASFAASLDLSADVVRDEPVNPAGNHSAQPSDPTSSASAETSPKFGPTSGHPFQIHAIIDARRVHLYAQSFTLRREILERTTEASLIEIDSFYERLRPGDIVVGTGHHRLEPRKMEGIRVLPIEETGARGLIRLFTESERGSEAGANPLVWPVSVADFEPGYLTAPM